MPAIVLVGAQWGDEGKGKNIDQLLSSKIYSGVARFQGGANAGHTLKYKDTTFIGHIVPSGCLHKNIDLYIGNEVVVDVVSLIKEIKQLKKIQCPVLVLAGDDEPFTSKLTTEMYEAIPNGRLAVIPGASHNLVKEKSKLMNAVIKDFYKSQDFPISKSPNRRAKQQEKILRNS